MSSPVIRVFRSDIAAMSRILVKLAVAGTVLLVLATVIGQWRADRFPSYGDIGLSLVVAPVACAAVGLLIYAASFVFPVKVLADGLRCYDNLGRYRNIRWVDVNGVGFMNMYGLKYVVVHASTLKQPLTVPLFLSDMDNFRQLVEAQAGSNHMLVQALRATAT